MEKMTKQSLSAAYLGSKDLSSGKYKVSDLFSIVFEKWIFTKFEM